MKRILFIGLLVGLFSFISTDIVKKDYTVHDDDGITKVDFTYFSPYGETVLSPSENTDLIKINGSYENSLLSSHYSVYKEGSAKYVEVTVKDKNEQGSFSDIYSKTEEGENEWTLDFSKSKLLDLNLTFGGGKSDINLGGLKVENLIVDNITGNVILDYPTGKVNKVSMDSMALKTEMGAVIFNRLNGAKAKNIYAEVDYGSMTLDLSSPAKVSSKIITKIGTGKMIVKLPKDKTNVIVRINDSRFSKVTPPVGYTKSEENIYKKNAAVKGAETIDITINVSMGTVSFVTD